MPTHAGGCNVHAGGGMECTSREGRVHIGQQALSLGQADIFGPAKGFRSCVGGAATSGQAHCGYRSIKHVEGEVEGKKLA